MASFRLPSESHLSSLKEKVVVLTGGANRIGAATVELLNTHGAYVVFGDIDAAKGPDIASSFGQNIHFLPTDVTSYDSLLDLFDKAFETYGRVDIAICNAGVVERPGWFEAITDLDSFA